MHRPSPQDLAHPLCKTIFSPAILLAAIYEEEDLLSALSLFIAALGPRSSRPFDFKDRFRRRSAFFSFSQTWTKTHFGDTSKDTHNAVHTLVLALLHASDVHFNTSDAPATSHGGPDFHERTVQEMLWWPFRSVRRRLRGNTGAFEQSAKVRWANQIPQGSLRLEGRSWVRSFAAEWQFGGEEFLGDDVEIGDDWREADDMNIMVFLGDHDALEMGFDLPSCIRCSHMLLLASNGKTRDAIDAVVKGEDLTLRHLALVHRHGNTA